MTNQNQKKQNKRKNGFNPITAAVTGAAVVAGVAAVAGAAVVLKDEKNREKAKQMLTDVKNEIEEKISEKQSLNHAAKNAKIGTHTK